MLLELPKHVEISSPQTFTSFDHILKKAHHLYISQNFLAFILGNVTKLFARGSHNALLFLNFDMSVKELRSDPKSSSVGERPSVLTANYCRLPQTTLHTNPLPI